MQPPLTRDKTDDRHQLGALDRMGGAALMLMVSIAAQSSGGLALRLVGNAGVSVSDGETSILVDLPYESGAFGYMRYDPAALAPSGQVVSIITHHHRDHFEPELFLTRPDWRVVGPPSVVSGLPSDRVISGDSIVLGHFSIVAVATPHTDDHRSYRVRWGERTLYFVGDTEDASRLTEQPPIDLLFLTPWLNCSVVDSGQPVPAERTVLYHLRPDGSDRVCGSAEVLDQGAGLYLRDGER